MSNENIIQNVWNLCHILRGDGISYHEYISELTYLLFLKIAEENETEKLLLKGCRWRDLLDYDGDKLLAFYQEMLTRLGGYAKSEAVRAIYAFPTTVFSHSENLRAVINGIAKIDWHSVTEDGIGEVYEGLLAKNSQDARSGAGQYFTPRTLVDCIVKLTKPQLGEEIQDPAAGSGGFLISAEHFLRTTNNYKAYASNPPSYQGMEIEKSTHRICLMNIFLHQMDADIILGDTLTEDARDLVLADLILANPPFGAKAGSVRDGRKDIPFLTTNKQLAFLQHIYLGLKPGGRAAVVLPDNTLFEEGVGKKIRQDLMEKCNLHTILRLPTGIFYSQGIKTNVLFFSRGKQDKENTKFVWVYDMRTNMPSFGKRNPLSEKHLEPFEKAFGDDPHNTAERKDEGEEGRFRCFSRKYIAKRKDNLDISWLKDDGNSGTENPPDPESIAREVMENLRTALEEMDALSDLLTPKYSDTNETAE
ncbi:MAG: N-6 DNA methylase [Nitrospinae bacterium]|nr:N-6 DNA methylase [Nitrospinota bacterium]